MNARRPTDWSAPKTFVIGGAPRPSRVLQLLFSLSAALGAALSLGPWLSEMPGVRWLIPLTLAGGIAPFILKQAQTRLPSLIRLGLPLSIIALLAASLTLLSRLFVLHPTPRVQAFETLEWEAVRPPATWEMHSYFYLLGAWPTAFERPIFGVLPYEKGPPKRFVGSIRWNWFSPGAQLTVEGPKTPIDPGFFQTNNADPRARVEACLTQGFSFAIKAADCGSIREAVLKRHITAIENEFPTRARTSELKWSSWWFRIQNPKLTARDQTQGFGIAAEAKTASGIKRVERWTLISRQGTHETLVFQTQGQTVSQAQVARSAFRNLISTLRLSDELGPQRALANQSLARLNLKGLDRLKNTPKLAAEIARIHRALLSKISVDPGALDAYYHLAGTAILLAEKIDSDKTLTEQNRIEITSVVRPLIASAFHYARDVAPRDPKTEEIKKFWERTRPL